MPTLSAGHVPPLALILLGTVGRSDEADPEPSSSRTTSRAETFGQGQRQGTRVNHDCPRRSGSLMNSRRDQAAKRQERCGI
jgi:hypothetical protein